MRKKSHDSDDLEQMDDIPRQECWKNSPAKKNRLNKDTDICYIKIQLKGQLHTTITISPT